MRAPTVRAAIALGLVGLAVSSCKLDDDYTRDFGWQCLMARRLAERDVRFIQISHEYGPGNEVGWDAHSELIRLHTRTALMVDKPIAGLLTDLVDH